MEHSDSAIVGAAIVGFGVIVFGIASNAVQFVGVGALVSIVFSSTKILYDRRADRRRQKDEHIQRLLPNVYKPLFSWAAKTDRSLKRIGDGYSRWSSEDLPDLSEDPEYNALVGDKLKNDVIELQTIRKTFDETGAKVAEEYVDRMKEIIARVRPDWRYDGITYQITLQNGSSLGAGLSGFLTNYDLSSIKFWTSQTNQRLTTGGSDAIPVPDGFANAATTLEGLPSYTEYKKSKEDFAIATDRFLTTMKTILRDGESDWHFAD